MSLPLNRSAVQGWSHLAGLLGRAGGAERSHSFLPSPTSIFVWEHGLVLSLLFSVLLPGYQEGKKRKRRYFLRLSYQSPRDRREKEERGEEDVWTNKLMYGHMSRLCLLQFRVVAKGDMRPGLKLWAMGDCLLMLQKTSHWLEEWFVLAHAMSLSSS